MIVDLNSKIIGKGGAPLVILHGLFGMGDNWGSHARVWAKLGFEVHLLDMRNHGSSPHTSSHTYEDMAEDIKLYVESNLRKHRSIMWIGHSMGGKALMEFSVKYPDYIEKMVIVDIGPKSYPVQHGHIIEAMHTLNFERITSRAEADRALEMLIPEWGLRQFILKNIKWKNDKKLGWRFNLPIIEAQIGRIGKGLAVDKCFVGSVLFIRGMQSEYILDQDWAGIMHHFPLAQLESIPDAGHWVHAEKPIAFLDSLKGFLII